MDDINASPLCHEKGNSPLIRVPDDYYPEGRGFWFIIPEGTDRGKKMFYRDSHPGDNGSSSVVVLVHGNPECSYSFRKIISAIEQSAKKPVRTICMDHIGFGLSDQATFEMTCADHAINLLHLLRRLVLRNVTLVVHDWGGPIGIGAFLHEPDRVSNLVVLNTTVFPIPPDGYMYHRNYPIPLIPWSRFPILFPDRFWGSVASYTVYRRPGNALKLVSGMAVHLLLNQLGMRNHKEREAMRVYRDQFSTKANARSSKRMVRETRYWGDTVETVGTADLRIPGVFFRFIQENLSKEWGPECRNIGVRALIGRWDPLGKDTVICQWLQHLPQLTGHVRVFEEVGHFINIEKPEEVADAILDVTRLM